MHDSPVSKIGFLAALIVSLLFALSSFITNSHGSSFVVFCDVGQGDATYIHLQPNVDIIIDAGKDASVLNCLGKYMPPDDKTIELAFISHLQNDHYGGFLQIPLRYQIKQLYLSGQKTSSREISSLIALLGDKKVKIGVLYAGDYLTVQGAILQMIWPTEDYIQASTLKNDPNDGSQVMLFSYNERTILFTGDVTPKSLNLIHRQEVSKVEILKVPHHGSKNGLIYEFLSLADPTYGVISVGKNNNYGHPSPEILEMLNKNGAEILRTDQLGDVVFRLD